MELDLSIVSRELHAIACGISSLERNSIRLDIVTANPMAASALSGGTAATIDANFSRLRLRHLVIRIQAACRHLLDLRKSERDALFVRRFRLLQVHSKTAPELYQGQFRGYTSLFEHIALAFKEEEGIISCAARYYNERLKLSGLYAFQRLRYRKLTRGAERQDVYQ